MPQSLPMFPLQTVLFPGGPLPLRIFERRYIDMISRCFKEETLFGVCLIREGTETDAQSFYDVGTTARIDNWDLGSDGLLNIFCYGENRIRLSVSEIQADGLVVSEVETLAAENRLPVTKNNEDLVDFLKQAFVQLPDYYQSMQTNFGDSTWLGYRLAELLPVNMPQKQYLLEINDAERRLDILRALMKALDII